MIDLKRIPLNVREFVTRLEQSVIDFLAAWEIKAIAKREAPGVYVDSKKICSIGLRIRKGCAYHGIAFNIAMDLEPFTRINPCGFSALKMTQLADWAALQDAKEAGRQLVHYLQKNLVYTHATFTEY